MLKATRHTLREFVRATNGMRNSSTVHKDEACKTSRIFKKEKKPKLELLDHYTPPAGPNSQSAPMKFYQTRVFGRRGSVLGSGMYFLGVRISHSK
ncbi:hypothetical protein J6590_094261, partial [Homalodisca vitripennis]